MVWRSTGMSGDRVILSFPLRLDWRRSCAEIVFFSPLPHFWAVQSLEERVGSRSRHRQTFLSAAKELFLQPSQLLLKVGHLLP